MQLKTIHRRDGLAPAKSWLFRLATLAFICLVTPLVSVPLHGLVGFSVIFSFAIVMGLAEGSIKTTSNRVLGGIRSNKWLAIFAVWYLMGVVGNLLIRGEGLDDWRLMMGPILLLCGVWYAFAFDSDPHCRRVFQVALICSSGVQAIISIAVIMDDPTIARTMIDQTGGTWIFGEQHYYAVLAMLLPMFIWRSFVESGFKRLLFLTACLAVLSLTFFSTFGTPLGLVLIGSLLIALLVVLLPIKGMRRGRSMLAGVVLIAVAAWINQVASESPRANEGYSRIRNLFEQPESGGYTGNDIRESRWYAAEKSLESFLSEPVWGKGGGSIRVSKFVGNHSSFLDSLGAYGFVGGGGALSGFVLFVFIGEVRRYRLERTWETLAGIVTVVLFAIGGVVNPYWEGWEPVLVLIVASPFLLSTASENSTAIPILHGGPVFFKEAGKGFIREAS